MNINGNYQSGQNNGSGIGKSQLNQESFMKLLLAQMRLQDPTKPFEPSTMMQQIAQLTGLSATQQLSDTVESFKATSGLSQMLEASQIVGKKVQLATDTLHLQKDNNAEGAVLVPEGVETVKVKIYNDKGDVIRTLTLDAPSAGVLDFTWDGLDDKGNMIDSGFYKMSASAKINGVEQELPTAADYVISSVALDRANGMVILNVDGLGGVSLNDVIKILEG